MHADACGCHQLPFGLVDGVGWRHDDADLRTEADFLLVTAGTAALVAVGIGSRWLLIGALWLALPTPFALLPVEGIQNWSPEFGWSSVQIIIHHAWKLVPAGVIYWRQKF